MNRTLAVLATVILTTVALAGPVGADIKNSPQAAEFGPGWCENGYTFESAFLPAPATQVGIPDDSVGVAVSLWITDKSGNRLNQLLDRPGQGLDQVTVWCYWQNNTSPTGFAGGDIILNTNRRG